MRIAAFILMSFAWATSHACSCIQLGEPSEEKLVSQALSEYEAVFVGNVIRLDEFFDPNETLGGRAKGAPVQEVQFSVVEPFKGVTEKILKTHTQSNLWR